jgi:GNAT superfamily N-acetyltransferase
VSAAELLRHTRDDEFAAHTIVAGTTSWVRVGYVVGVPGGEATGWVADRRGRIVLTATGDPASIAAIVRTARAEHADIEGVTVPSAALDALGADAPVEPNRWDWFVTYEPPPRQPGEDRVTVATPADEPAIRALLDENSPRYSATPGDPRIHEWVVIRGPAADGASALVAAAAHTEHAVGTPHLASIVTRTDVRGQGLGAAITAALTRRIFAGGATVVTLGMYNDNDAARRIYRRLGFRDTHHFASGPLLPPGRRSNAAGYSVR